MSELGVQILESFDSLPIEEQHEVLTAMLRRTGELPGTLLSDENLVELADELFQTLDAEESDGGDSGTR